MDYSNFSDEDLKKLAKDKGFAEEVSKKIRSTSSREGGVQDPNSAPILTDENIIQQKEISAELMYQKIQNEKRKTSVESLFNKNDVSLKTISFKEAKEFIKTNHYSGTMPVTNIFLGFYYKNTINCVIVYGSGACYRLKNSLPDPNILELVRLFSKDNAPKNMESYCISQSIKYIKENKPEIKILVSFADPSQGHVGYIYIKQRIGFIQD